MKALKHPGICKICGEYKEMSPEHIPPKHAFNSTKVMILPFEELAKTITGAEGRKPWELQGLKGTTQQGGYKKYCLCHSCNNDTGQWYMRTYTDIAKTVHTMIVEQKMAPGFSYSFKINNLFPLRLYKAVMTLIEKELTTIESVFVVSHHAAELELPIDSEIKVVKNEDGISEIV